MFGLFVVTFAVLYYSYDAHAHILLLCSSAINEVVEAITYRCVNKHRLDPGQNHPRSPKTSPRVNQRRDSNETGNHTPIILKIEEIAQALQMLPRVMH